MATERHPAGAARKQTGRPSKLTPELQEQLVHALRAFNHVEASAQLVGVHPATVWRWLAEGEAEDAPQHFREFREAVTRARAEAEVRIVAGVAKAALGGTLTKRITRTLRDGSTEVEEQWTAPDGRVGLEFLSRLRPDGWARRQAVEVTGAGGGPIQVDQQTVIADLSARLHTVLRGELADGGEEGEGGQPDEF